MRFVTRSKVHVDRIATAWAITRFIDPGATFVFVDRNTDVSGLDAIPFDMRGAKLGHHAGRCTFEVLLDSYELRDPALRRMGEMDAFNDLRDADIADGDRLLRGRLICEELYLKCRGTKREVQE